MAIEGQSKHRYETTFGTGGAEQGRRKTPHNTTTIEGTRSAYWGHLRTEEQMRIWGTITAHGESLRKASTEQRESARGDDRANRETCDAHKAWNLAYNRSDQGYDRRTYAAD